MSADRPDTLPDTPPDTLIVTTQTWLQVSRLAQQLDGCGCTVSAICPDESPLAFLPEVRQRFRFLPFAPLRSLRAAIAATSAEYLIPTDDVSTWLLYDLSAREPGLRALVERSLGAVAYQAVLSSRARLLSRAAELGIRTAQTAILRHRDDLDAWIGRGGFPFVLKKDGTWGGQGVHVVRSAAEAVAAYRQLERRRSQGSRVAEWLRNGDGAAFARPRCIEHAEVLAQSFIDGVPANSMYACHEGTVLGELQARVAATRGKTGPSIVIRQMDEPRIQQAGTRIAASLRLSGFFGLDFMLDRETGEPYLIECNPRATQLGHISHAGQPSLVERLAGQWTGRGTVPRPRVAADAIWFYPDGRRLTEASARFPAFQPDSPPEQMAALEQRMREHAPLRMQLRRRVWKALSRLKGSVAQEEKPRAFYYPSPGQPPVEPAADRPAKPKVLFHRG